MNTRELAKRIKKSRTEAQLSQGELGKICGVTDKSISAYEAGRAIPPLPVLEKLGQAVGKPLIFFLETKDKKEFTVMAKLTAIEREFAEIKSLLKKG